METEVLTAKKGFRLPKGSKLQTASKTFRILQLIPSCEKYFLSQSFWNSGTQLEVGSSKKASAQIRKPPVFENIFMLAPVEPRKA